MKTTTRTTLAALTVALVLGATACGSSEDPQTPSETVTMSSSTASSDTSGSDDSSSDASSGASSSGSADASSDSSPSATGKVAEVLAAIDAAEKKVGGTAYEVDDQNDDGSWEVDVEKDGRDIEVEVAKDGTVTRTDRDDSDLDADDRAGLKAAKITIKDAITTGMSKVDGTFDDVELEHSGGSHYWEVSVISASGDVEVRVDVETGRATVVRDD